MNPRSAILTALLLPACGGGPSAPTFPPMSGTYATQSSGEGGSGSWIRTETAPTGAVTTTNCPDARLTITGQTGGTWAGFVLRGVPCPADRADVAGTITSAGAITFTVTDVGHGSCASLALGQFAGYVVDDRMVAQGRSRFGCPDGELRVEESLAMGLSRSPTPPP